MIAMILIFLMIPVRVSAEDISSSQNNWVEFTQDHKMIDNFKVNGITDEAKNDMQPGDTMTFKVQLKNSSSDTTAWYMRNEVLQTLEKQQSIAEGGAYTYVLTYQGPTETRVLYDSENVGGSEADGSGAVVDGKEGLEQATVALDDEEYIYLDDLGSGAGAEMLLKIGLDGETQGNDYQDTLARVELGFATELVDTPTTPGTHRNVTTSPRTGDRSHVLLFAMIALAAGILCIVLIFLRLKNGDDEEEMPNRRHRRGRKGRKGIALFSAVLMVGVWFGSVDALAADSYETTYKVIIYSGDKGTFNGTGCVSADGDVSLEAADMIVVSNLKYGETVRIRVSGANGAISLNPEDGGKYQPTGTKRSGRDNSEKHDDDIENMTSPDRTFTVTSDRTFVVTYGVPGKMVPYTVSYVLDGTNQAIPGSQSETFYGVAGDKPVVSAPYFEGYTPVYKAITGTLVKGQENVWVFEYTRNPEPAASETPEGGTQTQTTDGTGTDGDADTTDTLQGQEEEETPRELLDLDDGEVPMSNVVLDDSEDEETPWGARYLPAFVAIGIAAVALLGGLIVYFIKKRKSVQNTDSRK